MSHWKCTLPICIDITTDSWDTLFRGSDYVIWTCSIKVWISISRFTPSQTANPILSPGARIKCGRSVAAGVITLSLYRFLAQANERAKRERALAATRAACKFNAEIILCSQSLRESMCWIRFLQEVLHPPVSPFFPALASISMTPAFREPLLSGCADTR